MNRAELAEKIKELIGSAEEHRYSVGSTLSLHGLPLSKDVNTQQACAALFQAIPKKYETVSLYGSGFDQLPVETMIAGLKALPGHVKTLDFTFLKLASQRSPAEFQAILQAIPRTVTELDLSYNDLDRLTKQDLIAMKGSLKQLESVNLTLSFHLGQRRKISDDTVQALGQVFPNVKRVFMNDVNENKQEDKVFFERLGLAKSKQPSLKPKQPSFFARHGASIFRGMGLLLAVGAVVLFTTGVLGVLAVALLVAAAGCFAAARKIDETNKHGVADSQVTAINDAADVVEVEVDVYQGVSDVPAAFCALGGSNQRRASAPAPTESISISSTTKSSHSAELKDHTDVTLDPQEGTRYTT